SPYLSRLEVLSVLSCRVGSPGLKALASSDRLPNLKVLDLGGNRIGSPGLKALAGSLLLRQLDRLSLASNRIDDDGMATLARGGVTGLSALYLHANPGTLAPLESLVPEA